MWALAKGAAKVICIEPNPSNLTLLRRNLSQFPEDKYEIIEKAVTATSGEQVMLTDKFWRSSVGPALAQGVTKGIRPPYDLSHLRAQSCGKQTPQAQRSRICALSYEYDLCCKLLAVW